ncbi:MAG: carboxylesterase family protein [Acidobacteriota bacterium]
MSQVPPVDESRRHFLQQTSLAAGLSLFVPSVLLAQGGNLVADTTTGKVRGVALEGGVKLFRGIPYGGDTSGKNRFMPPTKVAPWAGVRDCTDWGHVAPQRQNDNPNDYGKMVGWNNYRGGMSEDCLVLNVWTPALRDGGNRAVIVHFHGGGYSSGSGNLVALEGHHAVRAGNVVVVTVTHRLGALGYTDLSAFGGPELATSGNVGMLDLVAALRWIHDNIENFGGNPNSVLIFGQSGGGGKVCTIMTMPSAKGLFQRAGVQSGSTLRIGRPEAAHRAADTMLTKLSVAKGDLAKLQSLPVEQIIAAGGGGGPVMDGNVVPRDPFDPDASPLSANVPMIIGSCLQDASFTMTDFDADEAALRRYAETQSPGKGDEIVAAYRKIYPSVAPYLLKATMATDRGMRRSAITQGERKAAQGSAPAFLYRWDWPVPGGGNRWGATHGSDLSVSLSNPTTDMTLNTPAAQVMAKRIGSAFIAFAKTGNPSNPVIPRWPAYNATERSVMIFDTNTRVERDPNRELRLLWDRLPAAATRAPA